MINGAVFWDHFICARKERCRGECSFPPREYVSQEYNIISLIKMYLLEEVKSINQNGFNYMFMLKIFPLFIIPYSGNYLTFGI